MATLTTYASMTLPEAAKRAGWDDKDAVLGALQQNIDILKVMIWKPATHGSYNKQFQATRLGTGSFAKANAPITKISSSGDYIEEPVKLYEGQSEVDDRILKASNDPAVVRRSEDMMNLEGAFQDWAYNLFYGSEATSPDNFRSLARRRAELGPYCISAGGTGSDLTSAWVLEISPSGFYLAYPTNTMAGLKIEDRGLQLVNAPSGSGQMYAWCTLIEIYAAIVLRNERALIRYCNIETSGTSNLFSIGDFVSKVKNSLSKQGRDAYVFVNRTLKGQIEAQAYADTKNGALTVYDIENFGPVTYVAGIPVLMHEGITDAETAVS